MPTIDGPLANGAVTRNPPRTHDSDRLSLVAPAHIDVARWLLAHELHNVTADPTGLAAAVERVCQKFFKRLARVTSLAACQALLSRALHIPRSEYAFLGGVRAGSKGDSLIDGLRESLEGVDGVYARKGLEAVLGTLIDLLVSFIGQDLTLGMLREVWPGLPVVEAAPPTRSGGGSI
jgi:hypothetical protein